MTTVVGRIHTANPTWLLGAAFFGAVGVAAFLAAVILPAHLSLPSFVFYTAISNTFIPWLPHEPIVILYGTLYSAWILAPLAGVATCAIEALNYRVLSLVVGVRRVKAVTQQRIYRTAERWFNRLPFLAIVIAGITPVPYAPFRVLVVTSRYPLKRYLLGVFVGRTPRYFMLALLGAAFHLPVWGYGIIFAVMVGTTAVIAVTSGRIHLTSVESGGSLAS